MIESGSMNVAYVAMDEEGVVSELRAPSEFANPTVVAEHSPAPDCLVSTAFIPVCLRNEARQPQCFETTVVRGQKSTVVARHVDLHEALSGHDDVVEYRCAPTQDM